MIPDRHVRNIIRKRKNVVDGQTHERSKFIGPLRVLCNIVVPRKRERLARAIEHGDCDEMFGLVGALKIDILQDDRDTVSVGECSDCPHDAVSKVVDGKIIVRTQKGLITGGKLVVIRELPYGVTAQILGRDV